MKISYSKRADVLYIVLFNTPNHCSYVELPGGVITRIDDQTHRVVGVTIYNFTSKIQSGEAISIPDAGLDLSGTDLLHAYQRTV